jgi:hypothetical protein
MRRFMRSKRVWLLAIPLFLGSSGWFLVYPAAIVSIYGGSPPPEWDKSLLQMNVAEIHDKLGPPDEDVSAKDYQTWIKRHWWGMEVLEIIVEDCCKKHSRPNDIFFYIKINGRYNNIFFRRLAEI